MELNSGSFFENSAELQDSVLLLPDIELGPG